MKGIINKNKKNFLCIALAGAMAVCTFASPNIGEYCGTINVCAEQTEQTEELSFYNDGYIVISGTIRTAAEGDPVVLTVVRGTDSEEPLPSEETPNAEIAYMAESSIGKRGAWEFKFPLLKSGDYRAYIGTSNADENTIVDFTYTNQTRYTEAIAVLCDSGVSVEAAADCINSYAEDLGAGDITINDYRAVAELVISEMAKFTSDMTAPAPAITPDDMAYILKKSNMIVELNAGRDIAVKDYTGVLTTGGEAYKEYLSDEILASIVPSLSNSSFASFDDFDAAIEDKSIVYIVNNSVVSAVKELLCRYTTKLNTTQGKITTNLVTSLKASSPLTVEAIKSFISKYVEPTSGTNGGNAGGGGGGGANKGGSSFGSGKNAFIGGSFEVKRVEQTKSETVYAFDDIAQVEWAAEAITQLSYRGVLNGKANRIFAPYDNITREEFTKVITLAFKVNLAGGECNFEDVDEDSWAYPYIRSAYVAGIVNGISDTIFGIGSNITREDLCVMTDRIINIGGFDLKASQDADINFSDDDKIADYAKESVHRLAAAGIVSGTGDGFKPKAYATRAEAAKIVYLAMMKANR